ncbi:hypothetical protein [Chryseobacterium limigenitum]|uniref:Uncharacterized protein n=1 Tax=Chryseobacterium limigenitum TaxID=1612149 RepID=A0A1K2IRF5_9FLAO|nr:hypothetical protein [Chryseobacterium limigenitum]SFZ94299.1 hypothetical protein SAMN05216324_106190 [Chryseobacterium limigenitum]
MNYFLYRLEHIYTDDTHTACKFLGYFDDLKKLEKAKEKALTLPGFSEYPDGLVIKKCQLNKIHWKDGFNSVIGEIGRDYLDEEDVVNNDSKSIKELNLEYIFQISHTYTIHTFLDDERIIGVFFDENKVNEIVDDLKKEEGFKDYQDDFIIGRFTLNNQLWTTGF